jgi:hypothetical protein
MVKFSYTKFNENPTRNFRALSYELTDEKSERNGNTAWLQTGVIISSRATIHARDLLCLLLSALVDGLEHHSPFPAKLQWA